MRAVPPEFSADLMLRLAASPLIRDPKWKRELIDEAFASARNAQLPYRRREGDSPTLAEPRSLGQPPDALALQ